MLQAKSSQPDMSGDLERAGPGPSIQHADYNFEGALSHDIQPYSQNSSVVYLSSLCGGPELSLPTSTCPEEEVSEFSSLMDDLDGRLCRWGGSCSSLLPIDKSKVAKHLQTDHGVEPGGDKYNMSCGWDGCDKVMKKESISRHVVAFHLNNKTECASCGKQFAGLDSKLRHLNNPKQEECREFKSHDSINDSRVKRRRFLWP